MKTSHTGIHDPAFLELNRAGKIAKEQKAALISASASTHGAWLGLLIAFVAMGAIAMQFGKTISPMGRTGEILGAVLVLACIVLSYLLVHMFFVMLEHVRWLGAGVARREGRVEFRQGHYLPEANGKTLQSVFGDALNLMPGPYVFYCAKHSKWILSVERAGSAAANLAATDAAGILAAGSPAAAGVDQAEVQRALGMTVGFSTEDLELNRQGRMSRRQRKMARRNMRSQLYGAVVGGGFAGGLIVYGPILHPEKKMLPFFVGAGFGVLALVMSLKGIISDIADTFSGAVLSAEGKVARYTRSGSSGRSSQTYYYYGLGDMNFSVSSAAYEALIEGLTYRVYYLPRSKMLLALEPLPT
jgi:hypothetical protein